LQPARVREVLLDESTGVATVIVPDFQLSLAIGREGQNARLAARLTGWRIDIKSETQVEEERSYANQDWAEGQWVEDESGQMVWQPAEGGEAISAEAWDAGATNPEDEAAAATPEVAAPAAEPAPAGAAAPEAEPVAAPEAEPVAAPAAEPVAASAAEPVADEPAPAVADVTPEEAR
jgi:N utilization substance protein A